MLVVRTLGLQLLTAGVTVVLARLLTPSDYGIFAVALSIQLVGQNLAELGLPAALVRMREAPSAELQSATIGFLLAVTAAIAMLALAAAYLAVPAFGGSSEVLEVAAITLLAMPLYATRAVPMAMMDRGLLFGRVALVEVADTIGFNAFALTAAIAGLGVFSLAGAVPFGAALGMLTAWRLSDSARRPHFSLARVRPLLGFGSQVSVLGVLYLGRDLGYVTLIGAIGGTATAGFYAMAKRLFSFPTALAAAVSRVGLPTLSQSGARREERATRMIAQLAVVCGLPLALVAGSIEPLIVVILGTEWLPTEDIVIFGSLSMLLSAALASTVNSYRLAAGQPTGPVVAIAVELATGFALVALLIGPLDETGIGIAMSAATLVGAAILLAVAGPQVRRGVPTLGLAVLVAAAAAACGYALPVGETVGGLVASLAVVAAAWTGLAALLLRDEMRQIAAIARGMLSRRRGND